MPETPSIVEEYFDVISFEPVGTPENRQRHHSDNITQFDLISMVYLSECVNVR